MNEQTIGTCPLCGGRVTVPLVYWSIIPPVPTCRGCGATKAEHGPVIDMKPAARFTTGTSVGVPQCDVCGRPTGGCCTVMAK